MGHIRLKDKLFSMLANISLKEECFWGKILILSEKQKLPKRVWVKAAFVRLDEAEAGSMAVWVGDERCLVEPGKAIDIGFQNGPGWEEQSRMWSKEAKKSWVKLGYGRMEKA